MVVDHEWGEVREWMEGDCRNIQWMTTVDSWHELEPVVDQFLVASVDAVMAACAAAPVPWMVLSYDPLTGMLSVVPAREPSWPVEEGNLVELSLSSLFLEMQAERTYNESTDGSLDPFYQRFWKMVRKSLQEGESGRKLAAARQVCPLQIAAFNSPTGCEIDPVADLAEWGAESRP